MRYIFSIIFTAVVFTTACAQDLKLDTISVKVPSLEKSEKYPLMDDGPIKNVIFIIGDGTGLSQLYSGQLNLVGKDGRLVVQNMPVTGFSITHAANRLVTDSAAGATAYSCGAKTNNGMIAYLPNGEHCRTVLELAEAQGKSTGLVATSTITHATPASYASHIDARSKQAEIAEQYLNSGVEVFLGGGLEFFIPQSVENSSRKDDRNLIDEFTAKGYAFVDNATDLKETESGQILGLFASSGIPSENRTPTLAEMSGKAIEVLSANENGFFLMIEGSQIDWAGHGNDANYAMREVKDFDAAIKTALDFAMNDGETLVVVTADHETGGMTLQYGNNSDEIEIAWSTDYHTGVPVPLMAFGPHAIEFTGWHDNTEVGRLVARLAGLGTLPQIIE